MAQTFFFYDLETSGISPSKARIMQFAGQRTTLDLEPIGDPYNILVKLAEDIVPEPDAILITGITPQRTLAEGITEAEFFKTFNNEIATEGTIFVGFNSVRFDDEFMRYGLYRNFYDPYEWQWKDGRSRWDILDVVRMTRALRPEGIKWPFASDGQPTNRLELLTDLNGLTHDAAHDALSDVQATIDVARLIKDKQPKLFDFALTNRGKREVEALVSSGEPFVYVSGMYPSEYEKLTLALKITDHPRKSGAIVYDLRIDPTEYVEMSAETLAKAMKTARKERTYFPVKTLQYNRCPSVAPPSVLVGTDKERLGLHMDDIQKHTQVVKDASGFAKNLKAAFAILDEEFSQGMLIADDKTVDSQLYDSFLADGDKRLFDTFHLTEADKLTDFQDKFSDARLKSLVPLYKARNYPQSLTPEEREEWEKYRVVAFRQRMPAFMQRFEALVSDPILPPAKQYLLEEIKLYVESVVPEELF